jgi:hypothetical protein
MSIGRVDAGTTRDFSHEEIEALHRDASTSAILNAARLRAGQKGEDVAVRGDDGTLGERLADNKTHVSKGKLALAAIDAIHVSEGIGALHLEGAAASFAAVTLPIGALVSVHVAMAEMQDTKDQTRDAATRDVLHAGMLLSLELPSGFRDAEIDKLGVGTTGQAPAKKIADQIKNKPIGAALQLHCDQGVLAAEDFAASGKTQAQFFAACPKLEERYDADAAFKAGFDAHGWAVKNAPSDAKQMIDDVEARDARYATAHVPVRV